MRKKVRNVLRRMLTCVHQEVSTTPPNQNKETCSGGKKGVAASVIIKTRLSAGKVLATVFWFC